MTPALSSKEPKEDEEDTPSREDLSRQVHDLEYALRRSRQEVESLQAVVNNLRQGVQPVGRVDEITGDYAILRTGSDTFVRAWITPDIKEQVKPGVRVVLSMTRSAIIDVLTDIKERQLMEYKVEKLPKVFYEDVIGLKDELKTFRRTIEWIIDPTIADMREKLVKDTRLLDEMGSVMLFGPPGVGKTFMAKALAGTISKSGIPTCFIKVESYELVSRWLGESAENIKKLFKMARDYSPTILFMDEVDAIARHRQETSTDAGRDVQGMLNQLLAEMGEGFNPNNRVATVLATNYPQVMDSALVSRVKKVIYVPPPKTQEEVYTILNEYLQKVSCQPSLMMDAGKLTTDAFLKLWGTLKTRVLTYEASIPDKGIHVRETYNTTPRELKNVVQEAVSEASFEGKPFITFDMLETQLKKIIKMQSPGVTYQ